MKKDPCVYCGESTAFGYGRFVNRLPVDDGYGCAECSGFLCDKCSEQIYLDEEVSWKDGVYHETCLETLKEKGKKEMEWTENGRWAEVEIKWNSDEETEIQEVYIMNDKKRYDELCADDDFDQRVWFYFGDEDEFQSYFKEDNGDDWFIVREIKGDEE